MEQPSEERREQCSMKYALGFAWFCGSGDVVFPELGKSPGMQHGEYILCFPGFLDDRFRSCLLAQFGVCVCVSVCSSV